MELVEIVVFLDGFTKDSRIDVARIVCIVVRHFMNCFLDYSLGVAVSKLMPIQSIFGFCRLLYREDEINSNNTL